MNEEVRMVKPEDRRLDRLVQFDARSRMFGIREVVSDKFRSFTWSVFKNLDQGSEGACVGFAWAHELIARPMVKGAIDADTARSIYRDAQKIDVWPGEDYSGTSVLAGAKVVKERGHMAEYRWAFGLDDLRIAIGHAGPAVLGINWYSGMFSPGRDGYIRPVGGVTGGHAILAYSVNERLKRVSLWNSWGSDWGLGGVCHVSFDDMAKLLSEQGEACVPMGRK